MLNSNAANFASHKTRFVAVTIPSINNANFAETLTALTRGLADSGLQVLLGYTNYAMQEEERLVEQLLQRRPEAIVVTGSSHTERCRRLLEKAAIPVIEMWDIPNRPIDAFVGFSNAAAASLMVDHFHSLGLTRLAFIGGDTDRDTRGLDRRFGFIKRLEELHLGTERMVSAGVPPITVRDGAASIQQLLQRWPDTEAVMCVSDLAAFGAINYCLRNTIAVPKRIAIAGFGDYDISDVANPSITTIDAKAALIGELTARKILQRLELVASKDDATSIVVPELLKRESTAIK